MHKANENRFLYTQQRNKCVALLRNTKKTLKKNYYVNLYEKDITGNNKFWKTANPYFPQKCQNTSNENGELIKRVPETAEVLNNFL